jgi:hypothetical protein
MPLRALAALFALLASACALPRPYGEDVGFQTLLSVGHRVIDHDVYDGHTVWGGDLLTLENRTGWGWELGGTYGAEEQSGPRQPSAEFDEVHLGLRRTWVKAGRAARPYVGFGGAYTVIENHLENPGSSFDDEGGAGYAHAGILWGLGRLDIDEGSDILVGFDLRALVGDEYDALELALVVGAGR